MGKVLLVDDDDDLREALATGLGLAGLETIAASDSMQALALLEQDEIAIVVSDIRMPGVDGRQLLKRIMTRDPDMPVILMTGHGDIEQAVDALRQGAYDFLAKPFATDRLIESARRAIEKRQLVLENRDLRQRSNLWQDGPALPLIGASAAARQLSATINQIGSTSVDVLIEGEWGTGKRAIADLLFKAQPDRTGGLQLLDCGALSEAGLTRGLPGQGRTAGGARGAGGTLLLADVDLLPAPLQLRLLQALTALDNRALGQGGEDGQKAPRIFATSSGRLEDRVADGSFRSDLFFRIAPVRIAVPPLRERQSDIPLLFMHLLEASARRFQRPAPPVSETMLARLTDHDWPGNLRELQNVAEQAVLNLDRIAEQLDGGAPASLPQRLAAFEAEAIRTALRTEEGAIAATCARLGIPRKTLYDKLSRYGIQPADYRRKVQAARHNA